MTDSTSVPIPSPDTDLRLAGPLAKVEAGASTADHASIEDGPAFARGARWAASIFVGLDDIAAEYRPPASSSESTETPQADIEATVDRIVAEHGSSLAALGSTEAPTPDLGAAWRQAEEALPDGWVIWGMTRATKDDAPERDEIMVWAGSWRPSASQQVRGVGHTLLAALLALAARLRPSDEGPLTNTNGDEPQYTDDPEYDGPLPRDGRVAEG